MKKSTLYILSAVLVISLIGNVAQFMVHKSQMAQQTALLADLQAQLEVASKDLADVKTDFAKLEQDHSTLLADIGSLQAEIEAANQKALEKPTTSKPETKPTAPATKSDTGNSGWRPPPLTPTTPVGGAEVPANWGAGEGYAGSGDGDANLEDMTGLWP